MSVVKNMNIIINIRIIAVAVTITSLIVAADMSMMTTAVVVTTIITNTSMKTIAVAVTITIITKMAVDADVVAVVNMARKMKKFLS